MGKIMNWLRSLKSKSELPENNNFEIDEVANIEQNPVLKANQPDTENQIGTEFAPIDIDLAASIDVPVGFQFSESEIVRIYLSLDYSTLRLIKKELYVPQQVTFTDDEAEHTIDCKVPVGKYYVVGTLFYNIFLGGAEPIEFMDGTVTRGNTQYQSTTGISYSGTEVVDQKYGYLCSRQMVDEEFIINVSISKPFIVDNDGNKIELEPAEDAGEVEVQESKCYGTYYGSPYLISAHAATVLYATCQITIELASELS